MFVFPADERLFHANLMDGMHWYASQNLHWTSQALRAIHDEKHGETSKCSLCLEQYFSTTSYHHEADSTKLFLADGDTPAPFDESKKDWKDLLIQTPMGTFVNFNGLPPELQQEIRNSLGR